MELIAVCFLICLFAVANGLHVLLPLIFHPANTMFTGIAHYYEDYFFYVSQIVDGMKGSLFVSSRFTNEPLPTVWVYWFNALLGYIGNVFTKSPFLIYNVSLLLLITLVIVMWYVFIRKLFPRSPFLRIIALLFVLSATNIYDIGAYLSSGVTKILGTFWFSPAPAFNRLGGVPHQAMQTILIISQMLLLNALLHPKKAKTPVWHWGLFSVVTLWLASTNPMQTLLLILTAGFTVVIEIAFKAYAQKKLPPAQTIIPKFYPVLLMGALALPVTLALTKQFSTPLYALAQQWEYVQYVAVTPGTFIRAIGASAMFLPFAFVPSLTTYRSPMLLIATVYLFIAQFFFWSPLPGLFHASRVRFLQPVNYGLIPIFAAIGLTAASDIGRLLGRFFRLKISGRMLKKITASLLIFGYLFLTVPTLIVQIRERTDPAIAAAENKSPLNHVPIGVVEALGALEKLELGQTPVVVTDPLLPFDTLIPAITGKTSFTGHQVHTMYAGVKQTIRASFFLPQTSNQEALTMIKNHRIGAFFVSAKQEGRKELLSRYPFLEQTFANTDIVIFTVKQ